MSSLEKTFELSKRGSTVRQEIIAGLTTFLAMVYSVIVVPKMLGDAVRIIISILPAQWHFFAFHIERTVPTV